MELLQLKYFKTVAETGKISQAARKLFISAPALSTSISRLEGELGVPLFDRTNNSIMLNAQGRIFLKYVDRIFSDLSNARSELTRSVMQRDGHISLAMVVSTQWVDMVIAFSQEYPRFSLLCTSLTRPELSSGAFMPQYGFLLASDDDIPDAFRDELESILLFEDHPVVMVHPDHPIAKKKSVDLAELKNENIFLPFQNYPLYDHLVKIFADCSIPFPVGNAYSNLAMQQMVSKGLGIAFSTLVTSRSNTLPLCFVPISNDYSPWKSRIYWRKDHKFSNEEITFKNFIEEYYKNA